MSDAFDLMVAPNGARLSRADHPAVPITIDETAKTALACEAAGANAVHAHVRDRTGSHSLDPENYRALANKIGVRSSMRVQFSTEAVDKFAVAAQRNCLEAAPTGDASVALREIARESHGLSATYHRAAAKGVDVQHIVYSPDDLTALLGHFDRREIPEQSRRVLFVLGRHSADQTSLPHDLDPFLDAMPKSDLNWMACAFGRNEQACLLAALDAGGNVRIGFENNRLAPNGIPFPDNATSVASLVEAADKIGFHPRQVSP
ncbi:3-keto-5-aminohexanoate cleavage protein [Alisedimentitalea sp. MJ-SS2]|uniref:3-keto-5-aminohexanoate cleavage protein n=1 Tax=Aliisedimentitalea sp. MJ-SS2 TaxID=3049795 RepID=UPI00290E91FF|nr:3-keto-5-aminohexanoate cleavage protein [Alisedimentitalea sp. MJ-SS2]MDU8929596.1 3-keto-5-aminohexanoate cleavage protein [Alisedimentitalea sp. MJ-SS2]